MNEFSTNNQETLQLVKDWEPKLLALSEDLISTKRNTQNRTIKQILGHLIDSASNNTHRIIHLQNQESPLIFPNYATNGNNDRWIAIQNYQAEDWETLVKLWKYSNWHIVHVINNIDLNKLNNVWISAPNKTISLKEMVIGYLDHLKLHLKEIESLIIQA